jgi:hypothetical protein
MTIENLLGNLPEELREIQASNRYANALYETFILDLCALTEAARKEYGVFDSKDDMNGKLTTEGIVAVFAEISGKYGEINEAVRYGGSLFGTDIHYYDGFREFSEECRLLKLNVQFTDMYEQLEQQERDSYKLGEDIQRTQAELDSLKDDLAACKIERKALERHADATLARAEALAVQVDATVDEFETDNALLYQDMGLPIANNPDEH